MSFEAALDNCLKALHSGNVILFPSDSGWLLGADATHENAVKNLLCFQPLVHPQPLIVLLADERDLIKYVSALDLEVFHFLDRLQQPTAIIYEGVVGLAEQVLNRNGAAAIQLIRTDFSRHLIKRYKKPLATFLVLEAERAQFYNETEATQDLHPTLGYAVQGLPDAHTNHAAVSIINWDKRILEI